MSVAWPRKVTARSPPSAGIRSTGGAARRAEGARKTRRRSARMNGSGLIGHLQGGNPAWVTREMIPQAAGAGGPGLRPAPRRSAPDRDPARGEVRLALGDRVLPEVEDAGGEGRRGAPLGEP